MKNLLLCIVAVAIATAVASAEPSETTTSTAPSSQPARIERIMLLDVQGLWGGRNIFLRADGTGVVETVKVSQGGPQGKRFDLKLTQAQMDELAALIAKHDLLSLVTPERPGVPDEAHPSIQVRLADGKQRTVSKWSNDKLPDFDAVYTWLSDQAKGVKGEPTTTGKYDWEWRPEGFAEKPGPELTEAQAMALATEIANDAFANVDPKAPNADSIKGHKVNPQAWYSRKEGNRWVFVLGAKAGPNAQVSFNLSGDDRHVNVGFASK